MSFSINDPQTWRTDNSSMMGYELNMNPEEEKMIEHIFSFLPPEVPEHIVVRRCSKDYISLFYGSNDFLRLKYSRKARWISLRLPRDLVSRNKDNPLFAAQKNKNQLHWRADLASGINDLEQDINRLREFIVASCVYHPDCLE